MSKKLTETETLTFFQLFTKFQQDAHQCAVDKGWHDPTLGPVKTFLEELALMHSELSEAAEEHRADKPFYYFNDKKPEGIAAEFADVIIRIMDCAEKRGIPVVQAIIEKNEYNKTRAVRHGKKL